MKREWPDVGRDASGKERWRTLFSFPQPCKDFGSGALPAVVMKEVGRQGDVELRQADYGGKSYFYVVNTDWKPVTVELTVPEGTRNLVTGGGLSGAVKLTLGPYELMSFAAPTGSDALIENL